MEDFFDPKSLAGMDPTDAFKAAFSISGLTEKQLMERMGWKLDKTRRTFATGRFFPSFEELPKFCVVVGNNIVVQWIQMNVLLGDKPFEHRNIDCQNLILRVGEMYSEVGDVGQQAALAIQDGELDLNEIRRLKKESGQVAGKAFEIIADLGAIERELKKKNSEGA